MKLHHTTMRALAVKVRIQDHLAALGVPKHAYGITKDPNGWAVTILMGGRTLRYHVTSSRSGAQQLADLQHIKHHLTALGVIGERENADRDAGEDLQRETAKEAL